MLGEQVEQAEADEEGEHRGVAQLCVHRITSFLLLSVHTHFEQTLNVCDSFEVITLGFFLLNLISSSGVDESI